MKGVIFNVVAEVVIDLLGEDAWDDLLDQAEAGGSYTSLGTYDDGELVAIAVAASKTLGITIDEVLLTIGEKGFDKLAGRHSHLLDKHESAHSFVLELNDIIHPEVLKLYPEANVPDFQTVEKSEDRLVFEYRSVRNMPALAVGLLRGACAHFGDVVEIAATESGDCHVISIDFLERARKAA